MPKISIITTTYNHQDFIGHTIQSILDQTFSDWELLIGDDSSGEETWKIIQGYVAKYPNQIRARHHRPNKGIVENMNFLINKISKETSYVAFLEGDDMRDKNYLKYKLDIFSKYPTVSLVYNNLDFIDKDNTVIQKDIFRYRGIKTYQNDKITPDNYVLANVGPIISWSTCMIYKSMIAKYRIKSLDSNNKACSTSEYNFWLEIASYNKVYYIDQPLTLYRRHETNLSGSNPKLIQEVSDRIEYYYEKEIISSHTYHIKMSHNNMVQSIIYLERGQKRKSLEHRKKSIKYHRSSYIMMRLGILLLLCLPLLLSKWILSKIIKRG